MCSMGFVIPTTFLIHLIYSCWVNQLVFSQVKETDYETAVEKSNALILCKNKSFMCVSEVFLSHLMATRSEKSSFVVKAKIDTAFTVFPSRDILAAARKFCI